MTQYPIVSWRRSDGVLTLNHELLVGMHGTRRTRCGSALDTPWHRDVTVGVGVAECTRCLHLRAKAEGTAKRAPPRMGLRPGKLTAEAVSKAVQKFQTNGGVIQRLPAQATPLAALNPVPLDAWWW